LKLVLVQTTDPVRYKPLFDLTSGLNKAFCRRWGYDFRSYIGIKWGDEAWMACFNRIYLLGELAQSGTHDWALYLDADAFVCDPEFRPEEIITADSEALVIGCSGGDPDTEPWQINNGVMFFNLKHRFTRYMLDNWRQRWEDNFRILRRFASNERWDMLTNRVDDQAIFHGLLRALLDQGASAAEVVKNYTGPYPLFNYKKGRYVKQAIRSGTNTLEERTAYVRDFIEQAHGRRR
jgi:hypothetical protein